MTTTKEIAPWITCPQCGSQVPVDAANIIAYLTDVPLPCSACGEELDWWSVVLRGIEENFLGVQALFFVGAQTTIFTLWLKPGQRTTYRFSDHGIPLGSKVLYINYTPNGPSDNMLFPLEKHSNVAAPRFRTDEVELYPVPFRDGETSDETRVTVMVSWVPHGGADQSWRNLFDAFEAFVSAQYASMVVPANVAVESSLLRLMAAYLDRFVGKKRTDDFLSNGATYSHQLNILLPIFADLNKLTRLPTHIVGALNRLRGLRNDLAHGGTTDTPLNRKDASEILCGALFGFHYARYLHDRLCSPGAETESAGRGAAAQ